MKKVAAALVCAALACSMTSVVGCAQTNGNAAYSVNSADKAAVVSSDAQDGGFSADATKSGSASRSAIEQKAADATADQAGTLEITDPGTYVLTGELRGTVVVDPGAGDVTLVLDGVALNGSGGPAIDMRSGYSLTIQVPDGSVNTITNGVAPSQGSPAIQSNAEVHFEGGGVLCAPDNPQAGFQVNQNGTMQEFGPMVNGQQPAQGQQPDQQPTQGQSGQQPAQGQPGQQATSSTDSPTEVVSGTVTNSAAELEADYDNATYISMTDENGQVKITSSGTYVVSGECADGNITVKKGTTGVILVLENLDLTSTTGATVSINKEAEVQIVIAGEVVLTDAENPDDENSTDADVADAYDGAALKAKANSQVYVTGDGTLVINGNAKNGIKAGDDSSLVFDGVTVNITAANDGINANYDLALLSGSFTIAAGDDAIHADHILTVGSEDGTGPTINVTSSNEGLEGTVVNIYGGNVSINAADDAINAANGDGLYEGELDYSFNMMGGKVVINSSGDGIDSNGNINLIGGSATIKSASNGGEAGVDYDGDLYISDQFQLNNGSGVAGPDGMPGDMMGGDMGGTAPSGTAPGGQPMGDQPTGNQPAGNQPAGGQPAGGQNPGAMPGGQQPGNRR